MRDKLIELLSENFAKFGGLVTIKGEAELLSLYLEAEKVADHLIANGVTVQQWIPVKERLPIAEWEKLYKETGAKVYKCLIYRQSFLFRNSYYMTFGFFDGKRFIDIESSSPIGEMITHWMPIEPPKEGE